MSGVDAPAKQATATLPVFYAYLRNSFSPYDFSVQLCSGAACAVLLGGKKWRRARIQKFSKGDSVLVDLVDKGTENIISICNLRPLLKVFGRLPPLAMRCRMKDVNMNDLAAAKVNDFQKLISSFGGLVRVELADVSTVPFLVNLYHPTVEGRNLGLSFYCPNEQAGENARRRRWEEKLARMEGNFASDENSDEGSSDQLSSLPDFVLHLERYSFL
ncbi:unnamed protein product [Gongylonema pulchrum]|uniref:Tudor domain-containing protein n=1 Tax=Gongylonema pulchrum TaxID=637853 RepID=A0A183E1H7_9BILA|nr:unnamed protein product [Gongylonema pulchrum]